MTINRFSRYIILLFSLIFLVFFASHAQVSEFGSNRADPTVSLDYKDTITIPSFKGFDFPVRISSGYDLAAISLGFYYPGEYLEIDTAIMMSGIHGAYYFITDSTFRMAWSDINPINVQAGDTIITLKMNSLDMSSLSNTIRFELYGISEFADGNANVIEDVILEISEIEFLVPDPGDSIFGNYVGLYPNPFDDFTTVYFTLKIESQVKITLYNTAGVMLNLLQETTYPEGSHQFRIDGLDLAKGIYMVKFEISNAEISGEKIFKALNCR